MSKVQIVFEDGRMRMQVLRKGIGDGHAFIHQTFGRILRRRPGASGAVIVLLLQEQLT